MKENTPNDLSCSSPIKRTILKTERNLNTFHNNTIGKNHGNVGNFSKVLREKSAFLSILNLRKIQIFFSK